MSGHASGFNLIAFGVIIAGSLSSISIAAPGEWSRLRLDENPESSARSSQPGCPFARRFELTRDGAWNLSLCGLPENTARSGKLGSKELREIERLAVRAAAATQLRDKPECKQLKRGSKSGSSSLELAIPRGEKTVAFEILRLDPRTSRQSCVLGDREAAEGLRSRLHSIAERVSRPTPNPSPSP